MAKNILGVVVSLVVWVVVATAAGFLMRASWPAYAVVADAMTFTLPMMIARLAIGAFATLVLGVVAAVIARSGFAAPAAGVVLLLVFIPEHVTLWPKFPVWYHLTFLCSLVPLAFVGGQTRAFLKADSR